MSWLDNDTWIAIFIAAFVIRYIRNFLETSTRLPQWDGVLKRVWLVGFVLMGIGTVLPNPWLTWFLVIVFLAIAFTVRQLYEFRHARILLLGVAPVTLVYIVRDLLQHLAPTFYEAHDDQFGTSSVFASIWLFAFVAIANNQKKTFLRLEQERLLEAEQRRIIEAKKQELEYLVAERTAEITSQKEELEQALVELKATQTQLIQSEKMASLGELTAGIAHEIQNPLNFVNNFSEVSIELIDELAQEQARTDRDPDLEAEILGDLKQNLQKINHHGGRAASIVKGMLQHSRTNTGQRESTDINALCDEYIRLAYHGLRAKDKTFNALFNADLDASLGMVSVVPQDISRVLLNLLTNAFYAVQQRQKKGGDASYQPSVTISTRCAGGEVVIAVRDNGTGIPEELKTKIFQPFFTTKPTGEGTGLGLSLAYEIVTKGHSGSMEVESKEGEGTTFIITLPA